MDDMLEDADLQQVLKFGSSKIEWFITCVHAQKFAQAALQHITPRFISQLSISPMILHLL